MIVSTTINNDLSSQWATIKNLQTRRPMADFTHKNRVSQDFDSFFKGKNRMEAENKRNELLAEARRRFAQDPATLQKVEALIQQEAGNRIAAVQLNPQPLPPKSGGAASQFPALSPQAPAPATAPSPFKAPQAPAKTH